MKKLFHKFKGSKSGGKVDQTYGGFTHYVDHGDDSSKHVVNPYDPVRPPGPTPAPGPVYDPSRRKPVSPVSSVTPQDDVGTFSGFDSWLSSFTPDPHTNDVAEMPVHPVHAEVLTMKGFPPGDYMSLTLNGLRKPSHSQKFTVTIQGPWYMTFQQVIKMLKDHKYEEPVSAKHAGFALPDWSPDQATPKDFQILVTDGPSCHDVDAESGLLINRDEPIGHFTDTLRRLRIRCKDKKVVATSFPAVLEIKFNRTLRLPEDGKVHNQPSGVGHIPVTSIACISKRLQNSGNASLVDMARKGGVFFPLYQREAMFLSFKATNDSFAVRPFVGSVNAVSGLPWNAPPYQRQSKQDYISVPPQKYLDGIAVGQEIVRQFIAMPLGSGYSVEKQVTGKEDVGGMQLEIIPGNQWHVRPEDVENFSPLKSSRELNVDSVILDSVIVDWPTSETERETVFAASRNAAKWIEEHRPIYMRHLFCSQVQDYSQAGYGYQQYNTTPGHLQWRPGADVHMTAVYRFNLVLSYEEDGRHLTMNVEWAPWWTLEFCLQEQSRAGAKIMGHALDGDMFVLLYQGKALAASTLQEQHVEDNSILQVLPRHPPKPASYGGWYQPTNQWQSAPAYQGYGGAQQELQYQHQDMGYSSYTGAYPQSSPSNASPQRYHIPAELTQAPSELTDTATAAVSTRWQRPSVTQNAAPPSAMASPGTTSAAVSPGPQMASELAYEAAPPTSLPYPDASPPTAMPYPNMSPPPQTAESPAMAPPPMSPPPQMSPAPQMAATPAMAGPGYPPRAYAPSSPSMTSTTQEHSSSPMSNTATSYSSVPGQTVSGHGPSPAQSRPRPTDQTGWAMGIAAGSRIHQVINKDPFKNPTAWCKARATLLSIQILNSVAFESLTGMLAPPSPITPQMYKQHGLPFFASYGEGAVVDGGHNLAGVKSVGDLDTAGGNIQLGASLSSSTKVACTCCRTMLCDSILRPCNHTFCSSCIASYMTYGDSIFCRICNTRANKLIGFSAPMALPGQDRVDFSDTKVITTEPHKGDLGFQSIYELDGGTTIQKTVYELSVGMH